MGKGKVFLVGAGPGAPDLITVRGLECIQKADVLVYDRLVSDALIRQAPPHAELIFVGKSTSHHLIEQDTINELLLKHARKGKMVVRLKGGDPFIFGRGGEELLFLAGHGIPVEIIPGLSSTLAVPAAVGIPLTHRNYALSISILTGHRRRNGKVPVTRADTLVYLMPGGNLEQIVQKIITVGFSRRTPCALIENGTKEGERFISGRLSNIVKKARDRVIRPPALLVVGEVVNLRCRIMERVGRAGRKVIELQGYSNRKKEFPSQRGSGQTAFPSTRRS
jgi:uroporphyrin-III C-methyltransferase